MAEEARPKDEVLRLLKQLDDRLFLERQVTLTNELVWCVVVDVGLGHPPITILEWRDDHGQPIPYLSDRIVGRVARMERDAGRLMAKAVEANGRMLERKRLDAHEQYEEIGREADRRLSPGHSAVLHRGAHLARSRRKARRRGHNV